METELNRQEKKPRRWWTKPVIFNASILLIAGSCNGERGYSTRLSLNVVGLVEGPLFELSLTNVIMLPATLIVDVA